MLALILLALAGCQSPLPCDGPEQCGGNACCFDFPIGYLGQGPAVYCTSAPDACHPTETLNTRTTRMCETDADCVAGGISTVWSHCCPSSVMDRAANTCGGPCSRPGDSRSR
ncbi:MAG: hypothetical protein ABR567_21840 [Myxococcales bacterium]|nr:hypothetical protein [Myxococcales bacterium]